MTLIRVSVSPLASLKFPAGHHEDMCPQGRTLTQQTVRGRTQWLVWVEVPSLEGLILKILFVLQMSEAQSCRAFATLSDHLPPRRGCFAHMTV